jgi:hypothetical protein
MARKERTNMFEGQMEMSFGSAAGSRTRRQHRPSRARWWFERMRQIVDRATDWQPVPPPRPEQIWFPVADARLVPITSVHASASQVKPSEERQICE